MQQETVISNTLIETVYSRARIF